MTKQSQVAPSAFVISNISIKQDAQGRYCLNDLHKAAGNNPKHKPTNFLRLSATKDLCAEIDSFSDMRSMKGDTSSDVMSINIISGRNKNQGTYVVKELVYAYAMWISASFSLKVIRAYDALQNQPFGISEQLPKPNPLESLQTRVLVCVEKGAVSQQVVPFGSCVIDPEDPVAVATFIREYVPSNPQMLSALSSAYITKLMDCQDDAIKRKKKRMSVDATRWAWSQSLKASEKLVLLALADRAGENHGCWPSVGRLVDDTGLDRKTIMVVTLRLEECGLLAISREAGKGNFYQLIGVDGRHDNKAVKTVLVPKTAPVPKTVLPSPKNGTAPVPKTGHESKKNLTRTEKRERGNVREGFDVFWRAYPRKVSKAQAEKAWAKIAPDECLLRVIVAAVEVSKTLDQWQRDNGQFVPHPATWLNACRWEDELPVPVTATGGASSGLPRQPGQTVSQSSDQSQRGSHEKNKRFVTRREHSAAMGGALENIISREFGQEVGGGDIR